MKVFKMNSYNVKKYKINSSNKKIFFQKVFFSENAKYFSPYSKYFE